MANKKVSQLVSKPSVLVTDLFPIADPTTGQLFKTTISDLGTAIGSGVSSVNGLVGAVVLDTDDIQELASPTNRWFTDTRARAALSAASPLAYNSGTGVFSLPQADGSTNGFLSSADWTTFNNKLSTATAASTYVPYTGATANVNLGLNYSLTAALIIKSGGTSTQFLKADGSIDTNTYLTTGSAASTYLALSGGTLTGALNGTSATFTGDLTLSATNPRLYFTDTDNNPDYFISNTDGTFTIYDVTNSTSRFTIGTTGNGTFGGNLTVGQIIRSGGTSSQFLKADGSVDSTSYQPILTNPVTGTGTSGIVAKFSGTSAITDSIIYDNGTRVSIGANITTTNTFTSVSSTSSAYAVVAQASSSANGIWSNVLGTGEIFRGQTAGGSYFIINNGGNAFLNGNLNVGDFASTSYRLNVVGTANFTGALSGTSATFSGDVTINNGLADGGQLVLASSGFSNWNIDNFSGSLRAYYGASVALSINSSLAATFTSDVIAGDGSGSVSMAINRGAAGNSNGLRFRTAGTNNWYIGSGATGANTNLEIYNHNTATTNLLLNYSTGAATFSSSVTANGSFNGFQSGTQNLLIDWSASSQITTLTNTELFFGTNAQRRMTISTAGNVGIGTTAPTAPVANRTTLVIRGGSNAAELNLQSVSATDGTSLGFALVAGGTEAYYVNRLDGNHIWLTGSGGNTERMRITSDGRLLVGTTSTYDARVTCYAENSSSSNFTFRAVNTNGQGIFSVRNDGQFRTGDGPSSPYNYTVTGRAIYSDSTGVLGYVASVREAKTNINSLANVSWIYDLNPVSFNYRKKDFNNNYTEDFYDEKSYGLIADEVEKVNKDLVFYDSVNGKKELRGVEYEKLVPALVKVVQELKSKIETLENK